MQSTAAMCMTGQGGGFGGADPSSHDDLSHAEDLELLAIDVFRAADCFDKLFGSIAPITLSDSRQQHTATGLQLSVSVDRMALTDVQCNKVKELSGHLMHLKTIVIDAKSKHNASRSSSIDKNSSSMLAMRSRIINDREANRRYALIREYLISELTRSDELANELRRTEEELVTMTDKCNGLEKKLVAAVKVSAAYNESADTAVERRKHVKLKTVDTLRADDDNEEPPQLIGKFVRKLFGGKPFFGLVVSFEHPYFSIVYEDADFEEVSRVDLMKVLWVGKVPGQKEHACIKHAKHLGMLIDDAPPSSYSSACDPNVPKGQGGLVKADLSKGDSRSGYDNGCNGATVSGAAVLEGHLSTQIDNAVQNGATICTSSHTAVLKGPSTVREGPSTTQINKDAVHNGASIIASSNNAISKGHSSTQINNDAFRNGATICASSHNAVLEGSSTTQINNDAVRNGATISGIAVTQINKDAVHNGATIIASSNNAISKGHSSTQINNDAFRNGATISSTAVLEGPSTTQINKDVHNGATINASSNNFVAKGPSTNQSMYDPFVKPRCEPLSSNRAVCNYEEGGRNTNFSSNQLSKGNFILAVSISGDATDHSTTGALDVNRKRSAAVTSESASQEKIVSFAQKCADAGLKHSSATQLQWKPHEVEVISLLDSDDEEERSVAPVKKAKTVD